MKVLAIAFLVGVVSAGSGPYLPSGWRPSGPAFFLPSEVQKPSDSPLKETLQVEAEGSDFLREYGPPKPDQALPYVSTEQAFAVIEETNEVDNEEFGSIRQNLEVATEVIQTVVENVVTATEVVQAEVDVQETATEAAKDEDTVEVATELAQSGVENVESATIVATSEVEEKAVEVVIEEQKVVETASENVIEGRSFVETEAEEGATVVYEETDIGVTETAVEQVTEVLEQVTEKIEYVQENLNANSDVVSAVKEENVITQIVERAGKSVDEVSESEVKQNDGVENIADALVQLENEIKSQQVQEVVEVKTVQEISGSTVQDAPEGFLEYGPPGFREYGPPKELLRSGDNVEAVESNETRRRRFSPKFRSARRTRQ